MIMFSLYVQQNKWVVLALLAGTILTILTWLTYWAMWRPREEEIERAQPMPITGVRSFFRWILTFVPWVLILIVIGTTVYSITHTYMAATTLPNW